MRSLMMLLMISMINVQVHAADKNPSQSVSEKKYGKCYVVMCESNPSKIIVFDENERWIKEARSIQIALQYPRRPYAALKSWEGVYEPSNAKVIIKIIDGMKTINDAEFQKIVDDLHKENGLPDVGDTPRQSDDNKPSTGEGSEELSD